MEEPLVWIGYCLSWLCLLGGTVLMLELLAPKIATLVFREKHKKSEQTTLKDDSINSKADTTPTLRPTPTQPSKFKSMN